jgi:PD-(D/E)XK nuclease superfamily
MKYPRVTQVLQPFTNFEHVPKQILDRAAVRGSTVHALCAGIAKGAWIPDGMIGEEHLGYVNSFRKWQEAQVTSFLVIEKRYSHEFYKYSGQVDFIVIGSDGEMYLVDLKTSAKPHKTYPLQMAAYSHLIGSHGFQVKGAMLVYLDKDGEFPEIDLLEDMKEELHVYFSALECWHYFNKGKKNVGEDRTLK